jgi:hypothetical protein
MANFTHDCDQCVSLGEYFSTEDEQMYDLYVCGKASYGNSFIARYGNEPSEYMSAPYFVAAQLRGTPVVEAFERFKQRG